MDCDNCLVGMEGLFRMCGEGSGPDPGNKHTGEVL